MKKKFQSYVISYGNNCHTVFYTEWVLRSIFGIKYIYFLGLSFDARFTDYREAVRFRNQKKWEYLYAKKLIRK